MSTGDTPAKRYDVNITFDDFVNALNEKTRGLAQTGPGAAADPESAQYMQKLTELAVRLRQVVDQVNQVDPTLLAPPPGQPPSS